MAKNVKVAVTADDKLAELTAVKLAVQKVASTFTYMDVNVGSYVTDAELTQVATAAITALDAVRAAPTI